MSHIPEKIHNQRMRLQLESIESPSELPGRKLILSDGSKSKSIPGGMFQKKLSLQLETMDSPVQLTGYRKTDMSPVTDLAFNLCDTSLSSPNSPQIFIKKKLTMDYESSPSPSSSHCSSDSGTPLASITNKPKGRPGARSITRCPTAPMDLEANKENIPHTKLMSSPCKTADSPSTLKDRKSFGRLVHSPEKEKAKSFQSSKTTSQKRPLFIVMEDENSKDSGYSSQPLEEDRHRKKSRCDAESSMEDILAGCSPSKEGLALLQRSPCSKQTSKTSSDGFDVDSLDSLSEIPEEDDEESSSNVNSFSALLENKILSSSTTDNSLTRRSSCDSSPSPSGQRSIRRALSMIDKPSCLDERSPISRNELKAGFKRPEEPCVSANLPTFGRKKRNPGLVERSVSLQQPYFPHSGKTLLRSQSEVAIKKSFEFKDDNDDILPDSYGKYCLPSGTGLSKNHPNLRSITCHTLADLIAGKHKETVNSFRVIDVRYKFEYEGGHIVGAENWQHGEDEEFLSGLLPSEPLECPPSPGDVKTEKRNIVIFHCEFSSQRAPDFYKKLRERDRTLNGNVYPALHYPEIYLLHLGYKEFYNNYPSLCTGRYTEMADPRYGNELRQMRAKSKSWSGGTAARTGALARRFP